MPGEVVRWFDLIEDKSDQRSCHTFTLSSRKTKEDFRLKVVGERLVELINTPDGTTHALEHAGIAGKMRNANG